MMDIMAIVNVKVSGTVIHYLLGPENAQGCFENCLELKETSYGYDVVKSGVVLRPRRKHSRLCAFEYA